MYTLRILTRDHEVLNFSLGNIYTVSYKDSYAFKEKTEGMKPEVRGNIKSIIQGENGFNTLVTCDQSYFIMTDSGRTLERL